MRPNPERARELADVLATHGSLDPRHCWPRLGLIGCWLGGTAGQHASRLAAHFGPQVPLRDLGLIASEGRMTVPFCDATAAGPLAVDTTYFEFIPEDHIDDANPPVLLAHELEDTKRYYILLTTTGGLYRYDINDIVEVRGFYRRTPQVTFVRKGRDMVNIVGEKLHLNQVQDALRDAAAAAGIDVWQFRLIPDAAECSYDLLVETTRIANHDAAPGPRVPPHLRQRTCAAKHRILGQALIGPPPPDDPSPHGTWLGRSGMSS